LVNIPLKKPGQVHLSSWGEPIFLFLVKNMRSEIALREELMGRTGMYRGEEKE